MIISLYRSKDLETIRIATKGQVVGITSGVFDLFHYMHAYYLERCRQLCDYLIVGIDSDDLIHKDKGPERPILPQYERLAVISSLNMVDAAFVMGSVKDFKAAVEGTGAQLIFKNDAFIGHEPDVAGSDIAEVVIVPDITPHTSTSDIIEQIATMAIAKRTGEITIVGS